MLLQLLSIAINIRSDIARTIDIFILLVRGNRLLLNSTRSDSSKSPYTTQLFGLPNYSLLWGPATLA